MADTSTRPECICYGIKLITIRPTTKEILVHWNVKKERQKLENRLYNLGACSAHTTEGRDDG